MAAARSRLFLATASAAALALAACTTVGPDFQTPAPVSTAPGYAMAGEQPPPGVRLDPDARMAGPWWQAFGSPALDGVVRLALADSPSVAEARAKLERYQAAQQEATGERGPQAEANANAQRQKFNPAAFGFQSAADAPGPVGFSRARTFDLFSLGGRVSYDLDLFGGGRRRVEAAAARAEQAVHEADATYLALSANVALEAMRIAGLRGELAALEAIVADDRTLLDLAHKAFAIGGIPRSTVVQIEAQLAEDEAILPPLRRRHDAARHQLALLVGRPPADWTAPDFDLAQFTVPAVTPVSLPSNLVRRRPDILAAEAELHAATAAIGVALADQYPNIRLSANGALSALDPADLISPDAAGWTLLSGVTAPVFDGGARKARTRQAEAEARGAHARYRLTVLRAFVEVSDAMAALRTDQQRLDALKRAVALSGESADVTLVAARLGARTASEVLQSRRQLDRNRRDLAEAQAERLADLVTLYAASAADWRATAAPASIRGGPDGAGAGR
ncbi:MAG: efflux transporter outer membrane subunit [Phenylobacterium sp.]|uniref:efflux transporter outer membrane subunit n=1 Tax=Phenylobacterium sp. TaxID=1871053 RepID=UPI002718EAAD|nr:efflux transporter outer membrane subunit [Phenylobacterium sp.]MDO8913387.1 efflux transporter outer membrane subunit [Phenylobacterium sp.]MDP3101232.1 efflux transporter outer membrane subunit [Phenylobacterium sp.]HQT53206.1 efflux transporter outer membrane subunit [Phenylobacterium sp.]